MAFMDDLLGKVSQASESVSKKAQDLTDYTKYSRIISESEAEIKNLYSEIGYKVYLAYRDRPLPEVAQQIMRINNLSASIGEAKNAQKMLNETVKCPRCGARVRQGMVFCNNCGCQLAAHNPGPAPAAPASMQAPTRFCQSCGAPMAEDSLFCMSCGAKANEAAGPAPASAPNAYADSNAYGPNTYANPNAYTDPNAYAAPNAYADPNAYAGPNAYADPNANAGPNAYADSNAYAGPNAYADPNAYAGPAPADAAAMSEASQAAPDPYTGFQAPEETAVSEAAPVSPAPDTGFQAPEEAAGFSEPASGETDSADAQKPAEE